MSPQVTQIAPGADDPAALVHGAAVHAQVRRHPLVVEVGGGGQLRVIDTTTGASAPIGAFPDDVLVGVLAFENDGPGPWLSAHPPTGQVPPGGTTALDTFHSREGVCRDYAHLSVTLCRCLNIPARYVTGYLGDIGVPPAAAPMDFAAWMEVYLGGQWHTFDARNNARRIGRIVMARGRDATDVPIAMVFGWQQLNRFDVVTDEIKDTAVVA